MAHEVLSRIDDISEFLQDQSAEAEQLGRLPDATAKKLRESGLMRMLQPKEYGGYEAHPNEFLEAVMATGNHDPATGWIAGVVGVHPWETAMNDDKLQNELWSEDQDA